MWVGSCFYLLQMQIILFIHLKKVKEASGFQKWHVLHETTKEICA